MAVITTANGYRVTVQQFSGAYRAQWAKDGETVELFRWCDSTTEIAELLEELEWCE